MRLILGDTDIRYLERMKQWITRDYGAEILVSTFSDRDSLMRSLRRDGADLVLADRSLIPDLSALRAAGAGSAAFLGEEDGTDSMTGERVVGKYKRMDIFADTVRELAGPSGRKSPDTDAAAGWTDNAPGAGIASASVPGGIRGDSLRTVILDEYGPAEDAAGRTSSRVIAVTSFSGGTGVTTVASALARNLQGDGLETMYLNLELVNSAQDLFRGGGTGTLYDALEIIRSGDPEPAPQIRRILCRTSDGTAFFRGSGDRANLPNTSGEELASLITALRYSGIFSYIVVDLNYTGLPRDMHVLDCADTILAVDDGTQTANRKLRSVLNILDYMARETGIDFRSRMKILYNRFSSSKSSSEAEASITAVPGKIPPVMHATTEEIVSYLAAKSDIIRKIR